jgi:hypothetical protein
MGVLESIHEGGEIVEVEPAPGLLGLVRLGGLARAFAREDVRHLPEDPLETLALVAGERITRGELLAQMSDRFA